MALCHCRECQRATGGPFAANVWVTPGTPVFSTNPDGSADPKVISTVIAITNHPNFHRVQQLRELAKLQVAREDTAGEAG